MTKKTYYPMNKRDVNVKDRQTDTYQKKRHRLS